MIGLALIVGVGTLMAGPRPEQAVCIWDEVPYLLRSPGETQLVALVVEGQPRDTVPHPRFPWPWPGEPRGQRVVVEQAMGPGASILGTDSVAVVTRGTNDDNVDPVRNECGPGPGYDSLPVGTRHVFMATLRPDSLWLDGHPTWDVRRGVLGDFAARDSAAVATYQQFLATLPSQTEWKTDCRPAVERGERWLRGHKEVMRTGPFTPVQRRLREGCEIALQQRMSLLERWKPTRAIPNALRAVYKEQGCRDGEDVFASAEHAVDGDFSETAAPQWVFICAGADSWRLLAVVLESPPRIVELVRMVGKDWDWLAGTAPAEYFQWATSDDFRSGRWGVARPHQGVVLLDFFTENKREILAFFETAQGWVHVGVRCCYWPE